MNTRHGILVVALLVSVACGGSDDDTSSGASDSADSAVPCSAPLITRTTANGVPFVRTPDACFENLLNWPYKAKYVEIDGLRQAYIDEGPKSGEVILLVHGQPTWSYLYSSVIPGLVAAGHRVIAMDHLGMGRSDKPVDLGFHSFGRHVARLNAFMDALQLRDINLFTQDWGSHISLFIAADDPGRFKRIIVGNGGLPLVRTPITVPADIDAGNAGFDQILSSIPDQQEPFFDSNGQPIGGGGGASPDPSAGFGQWVTYARTFEGFRPSRIVEALTYVPISPQVEAAYDAPFPDRAAMAGPRTFPSLRDELIGITESRREALKTYQRPLLTLFGGNDPGFDAEEDNQRWLTTQIAGAAAQPHQRFFDASHYPEIDKGPEVAARIVDFIATNP
jgi:haloalkane dehalogenase